MNKHHIPHLIIGTFLLFTFSCSVSEIKEGTAVKAPASPEHGDCNSCHEGKKVLPDSHIETTGMSGSECGSCHDSGATSLWTKIPLSHLHQQRDVACKECHEDPSSPKPADTTACQKCHGDTQSLIKAAGELEINPHFSPHEGKIPDCNRCHHIHKSSENYCAQCHGMEYKVP